MLFSSIARLRRLNCGFFLQQLARIDDRIKVGFERRYSIPSSPSSSSSQFTVADGHWPNFMFTDDTWPEIEEYRDDERIGWSTETSSLETKESKEVEKSFTNGSPFNEIFLREEYREKMIQVISEELDLSLDEADLYLNYLRIITRNNVKKPTSITSFMKERRAVLRLYKKYFTKDEIKDTARLFSLSLGAAQFRISFLKDCGFKSLKPCHVIYFPSIQNLNENTLKQLKLLDNDVEVADALLTSLSDSPENDLKELRKSLKSHGLTLKKKYDTVLSYLMDTKDACFKSPVCSRRHHSNFTIESLKTLRHLSKEYSLLESYSPADLISLLKVNPDNLNEIVKLIPKHFDTNTLLTLLKYPNVLQTNVDTLLDNLHLLKNEYSFKNGDLDCHPESLIVETSQIKSRLENIVQLFGQVALENSYALAFIPLSIAEFSDLLQEMKENGFSFPDLASVYKYRCMTIKQPHKRSRNTPGHLRGLNRELGVPQEVIQKTLHKHPFFRMADNRRITSTYEYLKSRGNLSEEQLMNGLTLCLYDVQRIEEAFDVAQQWNDYEDWKDHPYFLEALLYIIEKNHSFDGSAVLLTEDTEEFNDGFDLQLAQNTY